jgi:hypothetical protein
MTVAICDLSNHIEREKLQLFGGVTNFPGFCKELVSLVEKLFGDIVDK